MGEPQLSIHAVNRLGAGPASLPVGLEGTGAGGTELEQQRTNCMTSSWDLLSLPYFFIFWEHLRILFYPLLKFTYLLSICLISSQFAQILFPSQPISIQIPLAHQRHRRSVCDPRTDYWCRPDTWDEDDGQGSRDKGNGGRGVPCHPHPPFPFCPTPIPPSLPVCCVLHLCHSRPYQISSFFANLCPACFSFTQNSHFIQNFPFQICLFLNFLC